MIDKESGGTDRPDRPALTPEGLQASLTAVSLLSAMNQGLIRDAPDVRRLLADDVDPVEVIAVLTSYLGIMMRAIEKAGGVSAEAWLQGIAQAAMRRAPQASGSEGGVPRG